MNFYWCKVLETEDGKARKRHMLVSAYNARHARAKIHTYYVVDLVGMGIEHSVQAVYKVTFDAGDICTFSRRMMA